MDNIEKILDKWLGCADDKGIYRKCTLPKEDRIKLVKELAGYRLPSTANREAVKALLEHHFGDVLFDEFTNEVTDQILSLISPSMEALSDEEMSVAIIQAIPYPSTEQERRRVISQATIDKKKGEK